MLSMGVLIQLVFMLKYLLLNSNSMSLVPFYKIKEILYNCGFYLFSLIEINKIYNLQYIECNTVFLNSKFFKTGILRQLV